MFIMVPVGKTGIWSKQMWRKHFAVVIPFLVTSFFMMPAKIMPAISGSVPARALSGSIQDRNRLHNTSTTIKMPTAFLPILYMRWSSITSFRTYGWLLIMAVFVLIISLRENSGI